jgi:hypothetical protein
MSSRRSRLRCELHLEAGEEFQRVAARDVTEIGSGESVEPVIPSMVCTVVSSGVNG